MKNLTSVIETKSKISASAVDAAAEFGEFAANDEVTGFVMIWINRDGMVKSRCAFDRRLELLGAVDAAKQTVWDS